MKNLDVNNFAPHSFADGLVVSHLPFGPTAYFTLSNTVMRHDIPKIGTMYIGDPHKVAAIISPVRNLANLKSAS